MIVYWWYIMFEVVIEIILGIAQIILPGANFSGDKN